MHKFFKLPAFQTCCTYSFKFVSEIEKNVLITKLMWNDVIKLLKDWQFL